MSGHIVIVEDEPELASLMADYVRAAGYTAAVFHDGAAALEAIPHENADLLVLDLMLPGVDGLAICQAVRATSAVPIVMVTARVQEVDRLLGLDAGADDYVCKPFSPRELVARIRAILRRSQGATPVAAPALQIDAAARRIRVHGQALELTPTEFSILSAMAAHPGQVFSRAKLLDIASGDSLDVTDRAIDSHIKNLRRKLAAAAPGSEPIHSIYGLGYRFDL
ncbi:MAG TPA: response regulator [Telluria sp.]|nr:response regulator [Telluria sp.]